MASPSSPPQTPVTVSASIAYMNPLASIQNQALSVPNKRITIQGKHFVAATMSVPTTAGGTPIPIGVLASLGWAMLVNNDPTNYVDVMTAVGGIDFAQLLPGEPLLIRFGSGVTAPALLANTAACDVEFLILEA
jgi:hypothetical protein